MRISARILTALVLLAAFAGCRKDDVLPVQYSALLTDWNGEGTPAELPRGMAVGIISPGPIKIPNIRSTVSGRELIPDATYYWAPREKALVSFWAYAPYNPSRAGFPIDVSVREDQRTEEGFAASDFISSLAVAKRPRVVPFVLEHRLSKLVVNVIPTAESGDVTALTLRGVLRRGTIPEMDAALSNVGDEGPVGALATAKNRFSAIVMPAETALSLLLTTSRGKTFLCTFPSPTAFQAGKVTTLTVNLSDATVTTGNVTFQIGISDWSDGGNLPFL